MLVTFYYHRWDRDFVSAVFANSRPPPPIRFTIHAIPHPPLRKISHLVQYEMYVYILYHSIHIYTALKPNNQHFYFISIPYTLCNVLYKCEISQKP